MTHAIILVCLSCLFQLIIFFQINRIVIKDNNIGDLENILRRIKKFVLTGIFIHLFLLYLLVSIYRTLIEYLVQ